MSMKSKKIYIIKVVLILIVSCMVISCKEKVEEISLLRDSLEYDCSGYGGFALLPIRLHCKGTNDTIWCMTDASTLYKKLYEELNVQFCDFDSFAVLLADKVEREGYLTVDSARFAPFRKDTIMKNATIDSIYQEKGIYGILENYVTDDGALAAATLKQLDYLAFLLYQHRIVCIFGDDELPLGAYLSFYATGKKKEEYLKILENSKSTMYICPFYLSGKDSLEYVNKLKMNGEGWKLE